MISAHQLTYEFSEKLYWYLNSQGLFGVRPECNFYIRTDSSTTYVEVFFLREKWHYESGSSVDAKMMLMDLAVKVGENLEKWINERVYKDENN